MIDLGLLVTSVSEFPHQLIYPYRSPGLPFSAQSLLYLNSLINEYVGLFKFEQFSTLLPVFHVTNKEKSTQFVVFHVCNNKNSAKPVHLFKPFRLLETKAEVLDLSRKLDEISKDLIGLKV